jgi:hypothetical protein
MKQEGRSFPLNQDVGVLKWRFQTADETLMPLSSKFPGVHSQGSLYPLSTCHLSGQFILCSYTGSLYYLVYEQHFTI